MMNDKLHLYISLKKNILINWLVIYRKLSLMFVQDFKICLKLAAVKIKLIFI